MGLTHTTPPVRGPTYLCAFMRVFVYFVCGARLVAYLLGIVLAIKSWYIVFLFVHLISSFWSFYCFEYHFLKFIC